VHLKTGTEQASEKLQTQVLYQTIGNIQTACPHPKLRLLTFKNKHQEDEFASHFSSRNLPVFMEPERQMLCLK
jgi:hypothetical protein